MPRDTPQSDLTEQAHPIAWCFAALLLGCIWWSCFNYLFDARLQYRAASFPHVDGLMTEYIWIEPIADPCGPGQLHEGLNVEYNYAVNGRRYFSTRKRFAWRQFDSKSAAAKALARSWGKGNKVKVFYDPEDPSVAALDNLFTPGDWKTLGCAVIGCVFPIVILRAWMAGWFSSHRPNSDGSLTERAERTSPRQALKRQLT